MVAKQRRRFSIPWFRWLVLLLAALFFIIPLVAGVIFSLQNDAGQFSLDSIRAINQQIGFSDAFRLSLQLALITVVISMALVVPTAVYVHLKVPKLLAAVEFTTLLPIVFPPIVLILGVLHVTPPFLKDHAWFLALFYVVLAMPFAYRAVESGLQAMDLQVLVEASRSLGGRWGSTLLRVILPNLTTSLISSVVLVTALVFSEYTMSSLAGWITLPVWTEQFAQANGHIVTAVAMLTLLGVWVVLSLIVLVDLSRARLQQRKRSSTS